MQYLIVLHTDDGCRYGVTVPDLPGCFSSGDDFQGALQSAKEAIDLHLEGIIEGGGDIPIPSPIQQHLSNPDFSNGLWALVTVDVSRFDGRTEKINITVPRRILTQIDAYAKAQGETRSGFLVEAARRAMQTTSPHS